MESTDTLPIDGLLDRVQAAPARLGRIRLISVDGPAGSGKSTLAARLAARAEARGLSVLVLHMDDLYDGWDGAARGFGLLRDHVLSRLAEGREGRYRRYDWNLRAYAERHVVPVSMDLLIVEGVTAADRGAERDAQGVRSDARSARRGRRCAWSAGTYSAPRRCRE